MKKIIQLLLLISVAVVGCATLSGVDHTGNAKNLNFPKYDENNKNLGVYPNIENLLKVKSGATKNQLYKLIGEPHLSNGFHLQEWDYIFYFDIEGERHDCQYKVLFDRDRIARNFYWKPVECENYTKN